MNTEQCTHRAARSGPGAPAWLRRGRIPSLDGVRAIAILLVLYSHSYVPGHSAYLLAAVKGRCGFLGVQLFFVLSGFLITMLLCREIARTGRVSRSGFYLRRALRILPAYVAYLVVLAVVPREGDGRLGRADWLTALTYTVNFHSLPIPWPISHVWSLSVEEHFYLAWPLVLAATGLAGGRKAAAGCVVACLAFRGVGLWLVPDAATVLDLWSFSRMDDIAFGCLLALIAHDPAYRRRLDGIAFRVPALLVVISVFALSQVMGTRMIGSRILPPAGFALAAAASNTVNAICIALLLWAAMIRCDGPLGRLLNWRVLSGIGAISYSLYLWHVMFCDPEPGVLNAFPQNLILTFAAALVSYHLIERPFLALKDRLSGEAKSTVAPRVLNQPAPLP